MILNISQSILLKCSVAVLACAVVGCEPAAKPAANATSASDHSHEHEHAEPATLAEAVKELEGICATIKAAFAKDDAEAAHEPLHEVGHVLEPIAKLADKSTLDDAGKEEVKKAASSLWDAFEQVDLGMHGDGGKKYSEVADAIDASLKVLVEKTKS